MVARYLSHILVITLLATASASNVVLFNPVSEPIPNRVTGYRLSQNTTEYIGATNALIITNQSMQMGDGVTQQTLAQSVVDGQIVRLMTQAEMDEVAATNAIRIAEAQVAALLEAKQFASNIVFQTDGVAIYLRAIAEVQLELINNLRTNAGMNALSKGAFKSAVDAKVDEIQ